MRQGIEITGKIDTDRKLVLDEPLPLPLIGKVRVIIFQDYEDDIDETEWLSSAANNPVFDFLKDPEEDIYTNQDGKPFNAKR